MAEALAGLEGFSARDWPEVEKVQQRVLDRCTAIEALVVVQAPLAGPMIHPMLEGIRTDVRTLLLNWRSAEADLERLWPHLPTGLEED